MTYKSENVDKIIQEKYSASFMNNTKWEKLINSLTAVFDEIFLNYKLVYDDVVEGALFDHADFEPYFIEPITYREVEWIEIPSEYEHWLNINNHKAGKRIFDQDLKGIEAELNKIGKFKIDKLENKIRLYAYL